MINTSIFFFLKKFLKTNLEEVKWIRWQAPVVGVALLCIVIYPMALFGVAHRSALSSIATFLIFFSFVHVFKFLKTSLCPLIRKFDFTPRDIYSVLIVALIVGYALLALAPVTSADSLDYHMGVPIQILNTGYMYGTPEWFHSRLSGNGEAIIALGLSVGAEQFGSLLQFIGLLTIVGLILRTEGQNSKDILTEEKIANLYAKM